MVGLLSFGPWLWVGAGALVFLGLGIVLLTTRYRVVWAEIRKDI